MHHLIKLSYNWHGGGGSPLYEFASWGGEVRDKRHRKDLIEEINRDLVLADKNGDSDYYALVNLLEYVETAEIGEVLDSS